MFQTTKYYDYSSCLISLTLQWMWLCCWQENDDQEGTGTPLPPTCRSLQSSYRDFLSDESTLLGQRQHQKELTFHTYPMARANSSFSMLSHLHGDLCRQTLPYWKKKPRESNHEAMPETLGHPMCLIKPRTPRRATGLKQHNVFCGTDTRPDHFTLERASLWVSLHHSSPAASEYPTQHGTSCAASAGDPSASLCWTSLPCQKP